MNPVQSLRLCVSFMYVCLQCNATLGRIVSTGKFSRRISKSPSSWQEAACWQIKMATVQTASLTHDLPGDQQGNQPDWILKTPYIPAYSNQYVVPFHHSSPPSAFRTQFYNSTPAHSSEFEINKDFLRCNELQRREPLHQLCISRYEGCLKSIRPWIFPCSLISVELCITNTHR